MADQTIDDADTCELLTRLRDHADYYEATNASLTITFSDGGEVTGPIINFDTDSTTVRVLLDGDATPGHQVRLRYRPRDADGEMRLFSDPSLYNVAVEETPDGDRWHTLDTVDTVELVKE